MKKHTKAELLRPEPFAFPDAAGGSLEDLIRQGARQIIHQVVESEVQALISSYAHVTSISGQRVVVRNGYHPERAILTSVGPVPVSVPKVRDRSGSGIKFNSQLVPPYVRRFAARIGSFALALLERHIDRRHE